MVDLLFPKQIESRKNIAVILCECPSVLAAARTRLVTQFRCIMHTAAGSLAVRDTAE